MKPLCKYTATCDAVRDIVPTLRRAFQAAAEGVPGPVFVELPIDVLYPISEVSANMGLSQRKRARDVDPNDAAALARMEVPEDLLAASGGDKKAYLASLRPAQPVFLRRERQPAALSAKGVVEAYLKYQRANIFCGAFDPPAGGFGPLPVAVPRPPSGDVARAAGLLRRARKPVLLVGSQATLICGGATRAEQDANSKLLTARHIDTFT